MRTLRPWLCSLASVAAIGAPSPGSAQVRTDLGPVLAAYAPLGHFAQLYSPILPSTPGALGALAWGAQGRLWLNPRFAVQLQASVASSRWHEQLTYPEGPGEVVISAQVLTATAAVLYRAGAGRVAPWLSAGAGVLRHGGQAYADAGIGAPVSAAGTMGLGLDFGALGHLTATADVSGLFYWFNASDREGTVQHGFQTDLMAHIAILWRLR